MPPIEAGFVECLDGITMSPQDLLEIFSQLSHRRGADEHFYKMDRHTRIYIADAIRARFGKRGSA
jgi:hypothetical protein